MRFLFGLIFLGILIVIGAAVETLYESLKLTRLARRRNGDRPEVFGSKMRERGIPESVHRAVLASVQWAISRKDFPVRAEDALDKTYGIADDDLWELVTETCKEAGRALPAPFDSGGIVTVEDLAGFVAKLPETRR